MRKYIMIIALALVFSGCVLDKNKKISIPENNQNIQNSDVNTNTNTNQNTASVAKEFTVEGNNFTFSLNEIKVNEGDTVRIKFINKEGFHDWVLDEFAAKTQKLQVNQEETIEFVANKKGTFEYYCSVGTHRQMGMKGNLIVE